jgi:hypothetical protein
MKRRGGVLLVQELVNPLQVALEVLGDADRRTAVDHRACFARNVLLTGQFAGTADFGGGNVTASGIDLFVAKLLGSNGAYLWSRRFGDTDEQAGTSVAVDSAGNALVTGYFMGTLDFNTAGIPLFTANGTSKTLFVAKLSK